MSFKVPTALQKKTGYGVDSVQRRLSEILYVESKPEFM